MKLVTYSRNGAVSCGILVEEGVIDIPSVWRGPNPPRSIKEMLQSGEDSLKKLAGLVTKADSPIPLDLVRFLAPVPRPDKVIGLAGNYSEHIRESGL